MITVPLHDVLLEMLSVSLVHSWQVITCISYVVSFKEERLTDILFDDVVTPLIQSISWSKATSENFTPYKLVEILMANYAFGHGKQLYIKDWIFLWINKYKLLRLIDVAMHFKVGFLRLSILDMKNLYFVQLDQSPVYLLQTASPNAP